MAGGWSSWTVPNLDWGCEGLHTHRFLLLPHKRVDIRPNYRGVWTVMWNSWRLVCQMTCWAEMAANADIGYLPNQQDGGCQCWRWLTWHHMLDLRLHLFVCWHSHKHASLWCWIFESSRAYDSRSHLTSTRKTSGAGPTSRALEVKMETLKPVLI